MQIKSHDSASNNVFNVFDLKNAPFETTTLHPWIRVFQCRQSSFSPLCLKRVIHVTFLLG